MQIPLIEIGDQLVGRFIVGHANEGYTRQGSF
jgi:hypothetical protein